MKCEECRKETSKVRRGMCLSCYRKTTGLSGGRYGKVKSSEYLHIIRDKMKIIRGRIIALREFVDGMIEMENDSLEDLQDKYNKLKLMSENG